MLVVFSLSFLSVLLSRTHTVVIVDAENNVDFYEETLIGTNANDEWQKTHLTTEF